MITEIQLTKIASRNTAANHMIQALCDGKREWMMSIPARTDYDPDLVISDSLNDIPGLISENHALEAENEELHRINEELKYQLGFTEDQRDMLREYIKAKGIDQVWPWKGSKTES